MQGSRLNTAPLELKRIKRESGIRKYQLTIPLSKTIKKVVNTTLIPVKFPHCFLLWLAIASKLASVEVAA